MNYEAACLDGSSATLTLGKDLGSKKISYEVDCYSILDLNPSLKAFNQLVFKILEASNIKTEDVNY